MTGKPHPYRLLFGLWKPKSPVPGIELSGKVQAVGDQVESFKVGDSVFGDISKYGWGSFAEYVCVKEDTMILKPPSMSYSDAAAIPHASMLASQGLIDYGKIKNGQKILINGAGGGMGTFALQIAKQYDTEVTGVDTGDKLNMMKSLGFDQVIDYKKQDFADTGKRYNLILDAKSTRPPASCKKAMTEDGIYVTVGGKLINLVQVFFAKTFGASNMQIVPLKQNKDLAMINQLYETGQLRPILDGPYEFHEIPKLLDYFGKGHHQGKLVVSIPDNP